MKKSLIISSIITLTLINFVSAYYGSYSSFSLSNLLNEIDSSTMILGAVFIISFALINFALSKFFKDKHGEPNRVIAGIVSFVISLWMTWEINKRGFDIERLFYNFGYNIGFSSDVLSTIIPLLLIAGTIYLFVKLKTNALFIIGGLLIAVSFTNLFYEKGITLIIGIILLLIGGYLKTENKGNIMKEVKKLKKKYPLMLLPSRN